MSSERRIAIKVVSGVDEVRFAALSTRGKALIEDRGSSNPMSLAMWRRWLLSEHSPIRQFVLRITFLDVPASTSVHFTRHSKHTEHYVMSSRPDKTGEPRDPSRPVMHTFYANAQGLIDMARSRLCSKAEEETRLWMEELALAMRTHEDPYVRELSLFLMPNCAYRRQCPEFEPCGMAIRKIMDYRGEL